MTSQAARTLKELVDDNQKMYTLLMQTDNALAAYVNEYGDELLKELLELNDDDVVEGEVISDDEIEEEIGQPSTQSRLDTSQKESE